MDSILITGADGFLGSHLTDFLVEKGYEVYALIRPMLEIKNLSHYSNNKPKIEKNKIFDEFIQIPSNNERLKIIECDIKNGLLLEKIIRDVKPILVFHFAAQPYVKPSWIDPVDTIRTNIIGTINLFEPIKKHKINSKVILACSSAEYGTTTELNRPLVETDPTLAIHPYGISKIGTELIGRQYFINFGIEVINLRYFNQTGPRKVNDACSDFVRKIAEIDCELNEPIIEVGNLSPFRDITGIKDSINATWLAATKGSPGETYNVCSSRKIQISKVLNIVLGFSTKEIQVQENTPEKLRETDEDVILGDNTKLKSLGFEITESIEDTLKSMYNYWIEKYKK